MNRESTSDMPEEVEEPIAQEAQEEEAERPLSEYEKRAIEDLNALVGRENQRAQERYRGPLGIRALGRVIQFTDQEGKRVEAETLDEVAEFQKNAKWKKWARFGLKTAGGVGLAAAMVSTGAGAVLTPILWAKGLQKAYDGVLEMGEEIGWGRKRSKAELDTQGILSQAIEYLKEGVRSGEITEEEYAKRHNEVLEAENAVSERQELNMGKERKGRFIRGILSTIMTIGTGIFKGVPLGVHHNAGNEAYSQVGLDQNGHRVFWNLQGGGQFTYNGETEVNKIIDNVGDWQLHFGSMYNQVSHTLGHGISAIDKAGLVGAVVAMAGGPLTSLRGLLGGKKEEVPVMEGGPEVPPGVAIPGGEAGGPTIPPAPEAVSPEPTPVISPSGAPRVERSVTGGAGAVPKVEEAVPAAEILPKNGEKYRVESRGKLPPNYLKKWLPDKFIITSVNKEKKLIMVKSLDKDEVTTAVAYDAWQEVQKACGKI